MKKSFYLLLPLVFIASKTKAQKPKANILSTTWSTVQLRWTVRYSNDEKQLQRIIDEGASVNYKDIWTKNTPLHTAAYYHKIAFIRILTQNGADVNAPDTYGFTPLHRAAKHNDRGGKGKKKRRQERAKEILAIFIEKNVHINAQNIVGETALHITARNKSSIYFARELIKNNIDINIQNKNGHTALHIAALYQNTTMIKLLLRYKADTTLQNNDKKTALDIALKTNNKKVIDLLQ
ncbi:MAG: ankyrin repeat domain-containing protein [Bacteroidota bacterium]